MLIIGAKGFAKEVLEVQHQLEDIDQLAFYDDISQDLEETLFENFKILKHTFEVKNYFKNVDNRFTLGVGNPVTRRKLYDFFISLGGEIVSSISPYAQIGHYGVVIGKGCNIMTGTVITNDIVIGEGVLINLNCTIGHDSVLGNFVEMSPGVHVSGRCKIGSYSNLGTNCTILPDVNLGTNVTVGAGAVVTKDVPDNSLVVGIPGIIKKTLKPLVF